MQKKKIYYILLVSITHLLLYTNVRAQLFTEVSDSIGLNYNYPGISNLQIGGGICVFDFNNDGWDDIFQAGGLFKSKLWKNNKGNFIDVSDANQLDVLDGMYINGAVAGDINNDGWEDLFIYNYSEGLGNGDHKPMLLLMNHNGKLIPSKTAIFNEKGFFTAASMGDYNKDGYLDIYVTNYVSNMSLLENESHAAIGYHPVGLANKFYLNNKNESFTEVSSVMNLNNTGCGLACCFTDFDNDTDLDLMLANDFGAWTKKGNSLYVNQAPYFIYEDKSSSSGFYSEMYGMSIAVGDYDNDLDLDYFISNIGKNKLLSNNMDGTFADKSIQAHLDNELVKDSLPGTAWSGLFFDMDNDMDLDFYLAKGNVENYIPKAVILDPNQLFENKNDGTYKDISKISGVDCPLSHRGAALLDFDHDGDIDIVSSPVKINYGAFSKRSQKIKLYRNNASANKNWIAIRLVDNTAQHLSPIGIHVIATCGAIKQMREVDGGAAHASQSTKTIYFGLGTHKQVDELTIQWDATNQIILKNIATNACYQINKDGSYKKINY